MGRTKELAMQQKEWEMRAQDGYTDPYEWLKSLEEQNKNKLNQKESLRNSQNHEQKQ